MKPQTQTLLAEREDGHTAAGLPGNCIQAAVASLLELDVDEVPHFALYVDWFGAMRRWARERDGDFTYFEFPVLEQYTAAWDTVVDWGRRHDSHVILSGPSPRGPFWHVVVGNVDLETTHDPHPSRAGLLEVRDAIVYCSPYDPPPQTLALTTRQENTMAEHIVEKAAPDWPKCAKYPALECVCRGALMANPTSGSCIRERTRDFAPVASFSPDGDALCRTCGEPHTVCRPTCGRWGQ